MFIATLLARLLRPNLMPAIQRYESMEAAYAALTASWPTTRRWSSRAICAGSRTGRLSKPTSTPGRRNETGREPLGFILSMEGADPVLSPEQVEEWYDAGLRIIGPAHYGVSPYAHGTTRSAACSRRGRPC